MIRLFRLQLKEPCAGASGMIVAVVAVLCMLRPFGASAGEPQWDKPVSHTPPASVPQSAPANAAGQESGHALFQRGLDAFKGKTAPRHYARAVALWRKAAARGDTDAQSCLGYVYYVGLGVDRSYEKAAKWYHRAAEAGAADAQHNLGVMYYLGQGVAKDNVRAMAWLLLASANGYGQAEKEMRYIAGGSSPQQISMARRIAAKRMTKKDRATEKTEGLARIQPSGVALNH